MKLTRGKIGMSGLSIDELMEIFEEEHDMGEAPFATDKWTFETFEDFRIFGICEGDIWVDSLWTAFSSNETGSPLGIIEGIGDIWEIFCECILVIFSKKRL